MSKLDDARSRGCKISLSENGKLKIELPEGMEQTPEVKKWFENARSFLMADLRAEQDLQGGLYRFLGYSTRKDRNGKGRLVIEFKSNDTGEIIIAYFNVNITWQRGKKIGDYFKTGSKGRFWIYPRSKLASFWIEIFGEPEKWSTIYRQMNWLKKFEFTGEIKQSATYEQLVNVKVVRTCV